LSGWLLHRLLSCHRLPSACVSASHCASCPTGCCVTSCHAAATASYCTAASHRTPLEPLIWLVVASPLITPLPPIRLRLQLSAHCSLTLRPSHNKRRESLMPLFRLVVALPLVMLPPPVRLHLRLSSHCRLSLRPSHPSCPAGCHVASHHAATSRPPAPPPLITLPPLTAPLLCLLSGWLSRHFSSCCHLPSTCASASHCTHLTPLVRLVVASPLVMPPPPPIACASASHCATASHRAPLVPLFWLVVASPLVMPPPPICLPSASHCTAASHRTPLAPLVWMVVALPLVMPLPPVSLRLCLTVHCRLSLCPSCDRVYDAKPAMISSTS
jgi:hypothetical protein